MERKNEIKLEKPVSIWKKPVEIKINELFATLGKGVISGCFGNWEEVAKSGIDIIDCLGISVTPQEKAWELVYTALTQAIFMLIEDNKEIFDEVSMDKETFKIEEDDFNEVYVDKNLFEKPKELEILLKATDTLYRWMLAKEVKEWDAKAMCNRLPSYFIYALNMQWKNNRVKYECLLDELETPFAGVVDKEREWECYAAWLEKQLDEPLFLETFSLRQIYIPLNAYYIENKDKEKEIGNTAKNKIVVELGEELKEWIDRADKNDALRVICGGPGCGKSSFAKIFAVTCGQRGDIRVLFIPLHHFELKSDLVDAINFYIKYLGIFNNDILGPNNTEDRFLIIFDGLDELALQGKVGIEVAQNFIREVQQKLCNFNMTKLRVQIIITGRDVVVQGNDAILRKQEQILNVLPYYVKKVDSDGNRVLRKEDNYIDKKKLLNEDRRQLWWKTYSTLKGNEINSMPEELRKEELTEITSQPLLNYLVALSYERKKIDFSKEDNLNVIYEDLIKSVYDRDWEINRHRAIQDVNYENFFRVLEEIALSTWHGDGRKTTIKNIEEHCRESSMQSLIKAFGQNAEQGVTRLLTAFYFRQAGQESTGDKTFEFTHKSFGEYLVAKRIIRGVDIITKQLQSKEECADFGWDRKQALKYWIELCGSSAIDEYIFNFITNQLRREENEVIIRWHKHISQLLEYEIVNGMPFEILGNRTKFINEVRNNRNAEEALMLLNSALGKSCNRVAHIEWGGRTAFGEFLSRLQGQRKGASNTLAYSNIKYINLSECVLDLNDLFNAYFENVLLVKGSLQLVILNCAKFKNCTMININLLSAKMNSCEIEDCDLSESRCRAVNFDRSRIKNTKFIKANLRQATFKGAVLENIDFAGGDLRGVVFEDTELININFIDAELSEASFINVDITNTNLLENKIGEDISLIGVRYQGEAIKTDIDDKRFVISRINKRRKYKY